MVDGISLGTVGIGSGWALVAVCVVLIFRGQLVPRRTYDDKVHEANEWRTESRIKDQQIVKKDEQLAEKDKQLGHLAQVGLTVEAIMRAVGSQVKP